MLILPFKIGKNTFSIGIDKIIEIIPIVEFMPVAESQDYICGLINYRGSVCPVIDISMLIGKIKSNTFLSTRIIIIEKKETNVYFGILAEQVTETVYVDNSQINNFSVSISTAKYIEGTILHNDNIIQIINTDIIYQDKLNQII
jgi:chemotaxis-related protein WspB